MLAIVVIVVVTFRLMYEPLFTNLGLTTAKKMDEPSVKPPSTTHSSGTTPITQRPTRRVIRMQPATKLQLAALRKANDLPGMEKDLSGLTKEEAGKLLSDKETGQCVQRASLQAVDMGKRAGMDKNADYKSNSFYWGIKEK